MQAQLFSTKSSKISFFSEAPLENIEAVSTDASRGLLDLTKRQIAVTMPIKSFVFPNSLMQEHFNENYLESDKYPNSTFSGTIVEPIKLKSGEKLMYTVNGKLTMHGVTRETQVKAVLQLNSDGSYLGTTKFRVKLADYQIKIPTLVVKNIAEEIDVNISLTFQAKQ
jgi:polyisoprenoid-binding protein YceI